MSSSATAMVPFLVAMMLLTGVCNTLLTKYQDMQCVRDCHTSEPKHFEQPVIQTAQMFIGEMGCWLVVGGFWIYQRYIAKTPSGYRPVEADAAVADALLAEERDEDDTLEGTESPNPAVKSPMPDHEGRFPLEGWKVTLLALPAICDICGTTLMNVGLLFVAASIYQMTRGALVLFVGLFSVWFLKRRLGAYKWFALFVVVAGVALVGLAGALAKDEKAVPGGEAKDRLHQQVHDGIVLVAREFKAHVYDTLVETDSKKKPEAAPLAVKTIVGVLLIAAAQIFTATQFVLEESIMEKYSMEPLQVVGWEGLWGFLVTVLGMVILHFSYGITPKGRYGYFDAKEGLREVGHYQSIAVSSVLIMISIGGFNFFGLSVTRTVSATSRSTIDTCRTLFIWIVSLGLGWETFKWLQVAGFALLVYGTFLFNDLIRPPLKRCVSARREPEEERGEEDLLPEAPIGHN
ncbi:hypothetical protein K402DRAFT_394930 [Aulographum hederae CBS 113979]|uniref:Integral membrane protein n=1 Tax=Aulographum hederae CBS 113979 TaxID=1176131 RepID=A0A6G1GWC8_9PEZI|nr:hypothetical protein K402DRAFT_394930 [Aulographum hederae CBS 113979]